MESYNEFSITNKTNIPTEHLIPAVKDAVKKHEGALSRLHYIYEIRKDKIGIMVDGLKKNLLISEVTPKNMTLNEWVVFGEIGVSSKTIWGVVTGAITHENAILHDRYLVTCYPSDTGDFRRCYLLYKHCNLTMEDMRKVADVFSCWTPFVDNWELLCKLFEEGAYESLYNKLLEIRKENGLL